MKLPLQLHEGHTKERKKKTHGHKLHAPMLHVVLRICKHALDQSMSNHQHSS